MVHKLNILFSFLFLALQVHAQPPGDQLTQSYRFRDGIYRTYEEFWKDAPSVKWNDVEVMMVKKPVEMAIQVVHILDKASGDTLKFDEIWGICIDNTPFVRVKYEDVNKVFADFAAIKVRGKICYFRFEEKIKEEVSIAAYNPLTGRPFRRGSVINSYEVTREKMMLFSKGEIVELNKGNLLNFISDDQSLWKSVAEISGTDKAKLYKSLLIYDDRNAVYFEK